MIPTVIMPEIPLYAVAVASYLLHTVFTDIGQIYRVGGDEFIVLSEKSSLYVRTGNVQPADQRLKEYNQTVELLYQ